MPENTPLKIGVLGAARIVPMALLRPARRVDEIEVYAVAARERAKADKFAAKHRIPVVYGNYAELLADPDLDAVYIPLPNALHCEWSVRALEAGKHVLCEKPLACNVTEAQRMFDTARRTHRVLVEAFMYRCFPLTRQVHQAIRDGVIGQLRLVKCSFNYFTSKIDGNVRFDAALAGGALMDIGCYCIDFARLMIGCEPTEVQARGIIHPTGVDEMDVAFMSFPQGIQASFTCGMRAHADNSVYLCGCDGYIVIPVPWKPPAKGAIWELRTMTRPKLDGGEKAGRASRQTFTVDTDKPLFALEADAFAQIIRDDAPPFITEADSIANLKILDTMRRQIGLQF